MCERRIQCHPETYCFQKLPTGLNWSKPVSFAVWRLKNLIEKQLAFDCTASWIQFEYEKCDTDYFDYISANRPSSWFSELPYTNQNSQLLRWTSDPKHMGLAVFKLCSSLQLSTVEYVRQLTHHASSVFLSILNLGATTACPMQISVYLFQSESCKFRKFQKLCASHICVTIPNFVCVSWSISSF